jgi:hypothetical protein
LKKLEAKAKRQKFFEDSEHSINALMRELSEEQEQTIKQANTNDRQMKGKKQNLNAHKRKREEKEKLLKEALKEAKNVKKSVLQEETKSKNYPVAKSKEKVDLADCGLMLNII